MVLEKAHLVDSSAENGSSLPSRDQIIHTIIFERSDVVTVTFVDVNLDYAVTGEMLLYLQLVFSI